MDTIVIMLGSLVVNVVAVSLTVIAMRRTSASRLLERLEACERELLTVDKRILVACHSRVRRAGEYWEFVNEMRDFKDAVNKSGILK